MFQDTKGDYLPCSLPSAVGPKSSILSWLTSGWYILLAQRAQQLAYSTTKPFMLRKCPAYEVTETLVSIFRKKPLLEWLLNHVEIWTLNPKLEAPKADPLGPQINRALGNFGSYSGYLWGSFTEVEENRDVCQMLSWGVRVSWFWQLTLHSLKRTEKPCETRQPCKSTHA